MGAEGGVRLGAYRGVAGGRLGAAGGALGECLRCGWGAPGSFWGLDGTEVLCFRRWEEVRGCIDDRIRIFLALLDALGVTPV